MNTDRPARFHRIDGPRAADFVLRHRLGVLPELALYDVRDKKSFDRSHVPGAKHLDDRSLGEALQSMPRRTPIVLYCHHGNASQSYAIAFSDFRFAEVYSVDGGFEALARALEDRAQPATEQAVHHEVSDALSTFLDARGFDRLRLDSPREHGLTPLMRAALAGRADLVDELLRLGVDVSLRNTDGNTALWLACVSNNAGVVQRLIDARIKVDSQNDAGATALMYAASAGKHDLVARLLRAGANPGIRNHDDFSAVDLASTQACLALLRPHPRVW